MIRECGNCKYASLDSHKYPCAKCTCHEFWKEPSFSSLLAFTPIIEGAPPLGVPLMVRTPRGDLLYPVYYIKNTYSGCCEWLFFPAMGKIRKLDSCDEVVVEWRSVFE